MQELLTSPLQVRCVPRYSRIICEAHQDWVSRIQISCARSRATDAFNASPEKTFGAAMLQLYILRSCVPAVCLLQLLSHVAPLWSRFSPPELRSPDGNYLENMLASKKAASRPPSALKHHDALSD